MSYQEGIQIGNAFMNLGRTAIQFKDFQGRQQDRALGLKDRKTFETALGMPKAAYEGKLAVSVLANQKADKNAYEVANLLTNRQEGMPQVTQGKFSDRAWVEGHQRYQQGKLAKFQIERAELNLSAEGRAAQTDRIKTRLIANNDTFRNLIASKKGGASKIEQGVQLAKLINGLPNGYSSEVIQGTGGKLQVKITNFAGEEDTIDLDNNNIDAYLEKGYRMVMPFFKGDAQQQFEFLAKDDEARKSRNVSLTSKAISDTNAVYRDKDGNIFYLVQGLRDPQTGDQKPPSFVTGVNSKVVIPAGSDEARKLGLRPWKESATKLEFEKSEADLKRAKEGLSKDQISFNQKTYTVKKEINKALEEIYGKKPIRPEKAKDMPKYNEQMRGWTLAQTTNEYEEMKKYYNDVLGESAGERINKMAMSAGRKLYRNYSKLKDETGQEAYLVELRNGSPELYEVLKSLVRGRRSRGATGQW